MPFEFFPLAIPEVIRIQPKVFQDDRGYFLESYHSSIFHQAIGSKPFIQDNGSFSKQNVLRGLHYQLPPFAQAKLVSVISGEILDVAVDIRQDSPTFGQSVSALLSEENHHSLYIPEGFAHGFCVLSQQARVMYKVTADYAPSHDRGIRWDDRDLNISWSVKDPILSKKDQDLPSFALAEKM